MTCKVCSHPKAFEVMSKVFNGDLTYVDAAKRLDMDSRTVWNCFANHWQMQATEEGVTLQLREAKGTDDYVDILDGMIKRFIKKLDIALKQEVTPMNVGAMTKLSTECRSLMRDILDFQGKLKSAPLIQLNIMQIQMTKLTNWLLANLEPPEVQKLLSALPGMMISEDELTKAPTISA